MNKSKIPVTIVLSDTVGGGGATVPREHAISLADILPYAPPVDRADLVFDINDMCPQQRTNYA